MLIAMPVRVAMYDPERWRQTRGVKHREMTFLTRPAVLDDEVDVRKFFTFDHKGRLLAFAFFDPIYAAGKVIGYLNPAKRRLPEADVDQLVMHQPWLAGQGRRQAIEQLVDGHLVVATT